MAVTGPPFQETRREARWSGGVIRAVSGVTVGTPVLWGLVYDRAAQALSPEPSLMERASLLLSRSGSTETCSSSASRNAKPG